MGVIFALGKFSRKRKYRENAHSTPRENSHVFRMQNKVPSYFLCSLVGIQIAHHKSYRS